jgi:hypothetical protein
MNPSSVLLYHLVHTDEPIGHSDQVDNIIERSRSLLVAALSVPLLPSAAAAVWPCLSAAHLSAPPRSPPSRSSATTAAPLTRSAVRGLLAVGSAPHKLHPFLRLVWDLPA